MPLKSLGLRNFTSSSPKVNTKQYQQFQTNKNNNNDKKNNNTKNNNNKRFSASMLHDAAYQGDVEALEAILSSRSVDVNAQDCNTRSTALHKAASCNRIDAMKLLISYGAEKEATDGVDATPLHYAASHGHMGAVATLVLQKVNVNAKDVYGYTPFHAALKKNHFELADTLRMYGADINTKTETGSTALHLACDSEETDTVKFLLENGARQVRDFQGNPPLFKAISAGNVDLCRLMLQYVNIIHDLANAERQTVLHVVANVSGREALDILRLIIDKCKRQSNAANLNSLINARDSSGRTALHWAVQPGIAYGVTKELIRNGADPTLKDNEGNTPVHICGSCRRTIVAKYLIRNGGKCHKSVAKQLGI